MAVAKKLTQSQLKQLAHQPALLRFEAQRAVAADPSNRVALLCSRRAGKTEEFCFQAAESLNSTSNSHVVFIGLSAKSAREIFYSRFKSLNSDHGWGYTFNEQRLSISHPTNGSVLLILGSDSRDDVEKIRGLSRLVLLIIDEAGAWRQGLIQYVIEEVAGPALKDLKGKILLGGTPGPILYGYWYEVTTNQHPSWSIHRWNLTANPHIPADTLDEVLRENNWTRDNHKFRREYLAEWTRDEAFLVFPFSTTKHCKPTPTNIHWDTVLSVDFGTVHSTAFVVLASNPAVREVYVLHASKAAGLTTTDIAARIKSLATRYSVPQHRMIGDLGGMGKYAANDLLKLHDIKLECADKAKKLAGIELVIDAIASNQLIFTTDSLCLQQELQILTWNELHSDIAPNQPDDATDALIYGFRKLNHRYVVPVAIDSDEYDWDYLDKPRKQPYDSVRLV